MPLDELLPDADVVTSHERLVTASPETAFAAALGIPVAPDRLTGALFRVRGLPGGGSLEGAMRALGFAELERTPTRLVIGAAGTPWRPRGRLVRWDAYGPGQVRMALELAAEAAGEGRTLLRTETRVAAADAPARRAFRRYWLAAAARTAEGR